MVDIRSFAAESMSNISNALDRNVNTVPVDNGVGSTIYQYRQKQKLISYDEAKTMLADVGIEDGYRTLNDKMYPYFYRLFNLNIREREQTLYLLGNDAVMLGDQDFVTPLTDTPAYAEGIGYVGFMGETKLSEKVGVDSTQYDTVTHSPFYNRGQLYKKTNNLYPDENDTGVNGESDYVFNKWDVSDPNSILYKTKNLFRQRKINTLISRFGTHADGNPNTISYNGENGDPIYGESRGRNLLTKAAERSGSSYKVNGYNNPYCRVWTHHHQFARMVDVMRPFEKENGRSVSQAEFNKWENFTIDERLSDGVWGWKNGDAEWDRSVIDRETGFLNIAPKYTDGGGAANVHAKDCMFSLENLAWKDFDPFSFEKALSWEQRGPNGGRIMWFPPYGLTFNEVVNAEWTENKFIGRGENVYSYSNTKRTGTLSFLMVVDHPSSVDYALWPYETDTYERELTDTDLLRYFAGCDYETVTSAARPTPLTDEYLDFSSDETLYTLSEPVNVEGGEKILTVKSKLYFPNNYSGFWDLKLFNSNPLAYIFNGYSAGVKITAEKWKYETYSYGDENEGFWKPLAIASDNGACGGYEMRVGKGVSYKCDEEIVDNYIVNDTVSYIRNDTGTYGTGDKIYYREDGIPVRPNGENAKEISTNNNDSITVPNNLKGDVEYSNQTIFVVLGTGVSNDYAMNTYGQTGLSKDGGNEDKKSLGLNSLSDGEGYLPFSVFSAICAFKNDEDVQYTSGKTIKKSALIETLINECNTDTEKKLAKEFYNLVSKMKEDVVKVDVKTCGNASLDGASTGTKDELSKKKHERNVYLAGARAYTTDKIISDFLSKSLGTNKVSGNHYSIMYDGGNKTSNSNSEESKKKRCAEVVLEITYKTTQTSYVSEGKNVDKGSVDEFIDGYESTGEYAYSNGETTFSAPEYQPDVEEAGPDKRPIYRKDGVMYVEYSQGQWTTLDKYVALCRMRQDGGLSGDGKTYTRALGRGDTTAVNKIRYDQEYHFFKKLKAEAPIVFDRLVQKLKYFDPAFHSMTPEGFNARLTFLQQCTRQGDTTTASDSGSTSANNLAFGRPPFCVLRLGDFYNQMIVIRSVNFDYSVSEGLMWDLNHDGIGVEPMLCKATIAFDFVGGGDLAGPVRRLQNAMSFNYYANTSLYDNRADRPKYVWDPVTGKAEFKPEESYAYSAEKSYTKGKDAFGVDPTKQYVSGASEMVMDSAWRLREDSEQRKKDVETVINSLEGNDLMSSPNKNPYDKNTEIEDVDPVQEELPKKVIMEELRDQYQIDFDIV